MTIFELQQVLADAVSKGSPPSAEVVVYVDGAAAFEKVVGAKSRALYSVTIQKTGFTYFVNHEVHSAHTGSVTFDGIRSCLELEVQ